jgi:hypothetical protein
MRNNAVNNSGRPPQATSPTSSFNLVTSALSVRAHKTRIVSECGKTERRDMPTPKLTNELVIAAIKGFEEQKRDIDAQIAELRAFLSN